MIAHLITPMPTMDWLQERAHKAFKALNLGKVDVEIVRTDDDALIAVALPDRVKDGKTPMSVFRFKNGYGIRQKIEQAFYAAAADLDKKVLKESTKH